ncbi:MAG: hypothetical protein ACE5EB_08120, partial [Thermodesulfobacteriota bacterium]
MDDNIFVLNIKGGVVEKIAEPAALKPEADKDVERKVIARLLNPDAPKKADGSAAPAQSRPAPKQAWGIAAPPQPKPAAPGTV